MFYCPENMKLMNGKQVLFGGKQLKDNPWKEWLRCTNVNKLELPDCLTENCERNYFAGGKSASFPFIRSFRQSNRNSKGPEKKKENFGREEGIAILEFGGHWGGGGGMRILEFPMARGVKILMPPVAGYGYLL